MKKYISALLVVVSGMMFSQTILNAKSPDEFRKLRDDNMKIVGDSVVSNKVTPLSYGYVDERDVLKSVYVWEVIDLNDKVNQPFYYNNTNAFSRQNKSLYTILLEGALNGEFTEVYDDENFTTKLDADGIKRKLSYEVIADEALDIIESGRQLTPEEVIRYTDVYETTNDKVRMIKMMGMWFIDKRDGQLKYRPLGIAAMGPDPTFTAQKARGLIMSDEEELVDLFWIFYPDAREVLANNEVYNRKNQSADLSFDDLLNARRFSSVIYKSSAGLGEGLIKDYVPRNAEEQIEESNRIKGQILAMENEMWNY
ncbi:type IX secretion system ring subunit PorN/GldN [Chryseobacterium lacus]|uniref:type IX secretion system ring protein PorN/GldN n=1 Tax=Chryseobacterium lacus TaxID=2058346 RepID=UPI00086C4294|nr:gliding motility protein GldN [Chryseobacterium lacus]ODS88668.1 MAG: gliding motility protein GldN [Chryseobacterium sp. SCN 40-13]RST29175.1 gliding motility protein GldN [Chryseobacterium lacus]